jgi:hypothetical protein
MATWHQAKIRYQKEDEAGTLKTVNEVYLFDSVSFTEAEAQAYKRIVTGASDFSVTSITRMRLADLFMYDEGEQFFKAKVVYFSVDEKSGHEKRIVNQMLVNADSTGQALDRINESMRNFLMPYTIESVALTPILDVYPYINEGDVEIPANLKKIE